MSIPLILLVGPTASGKTEVAIPLAQALQAEIISSDSMQVYRGMDIGTAKPTLAQRRIVPHHLIDICDPWQPFSAAMFVELAKQAIEDIANRGKRVLLVGGTALYIKTLLEGIFVGPSANWDIRGELTKQTVESLYDELTCVDPEAASHIYAQDMRRIIRALEVYYTTGIPISQYQRLYTQKVGDFAPFFIGIQWERSILHQRIAERVTKMLSDGLVAETQRLLALPYPISYTAAQAIGYKEAIAAIHTPELLTSLSTIIQRNTKSFAKRQITWLRRFPINWLVASPTSDPAHLVEEALALIEKTN
jgi:tRNA dimethylallyltransferase